MHVSWSWKRSLAATATLCVVTAGAVAGSRALPSHAADAYATVTDQRLADAGKDDGWLMYRRTWDSQGYAPFDQITAANVGS